MAKGSAMDSGKQTFAVKVNWRVKGAINCGLPQAWPNDVAFGPALVGTPVNLSKTFLINLTLLSRHSL